MVRNSLLKARTDAKRSLAASRGINHLSLLLGLLMPTMHCRTPLALVASCYLASWGSICCHAIALPSRTAQDSMPGLLVSPRDRRDVELIASADDQQFLASSIQTSLGLRLQGTDGTSELSYGRHSSKTVGETRISALESIPWSCVYCLWER